MSRKTRRGLVLVFTLVALLMVIGGIFLDAVLDGSPIRMAVYWGTCLLLVCLVFLGAIIDLRAIRKEFKVRQAELDDQLSKNLAKAYEPKEKQQ